MFIITTIVTRWYVAKFDSPSNYATVKDYMHSKYYKFNIFLVSMENSCLIIIYMNSNEWKFPVIAFLFSLVNSFFLSKYNKKR